jgi:prepilin-type processing-associated H-X9-DG protein
LQDRAGICNTSTFGSAHPAGFNMAFCDGSIHLMSFLVDPTIHQNLGSRNDGQPIDPSKF